MWTQVGGRIARLRKERSLSQSEFGAMIGLSAQSIGKLERGHHCISGDVLAKICTELDVSSDYILFGNASSTDITGTLKGVSSEQFDIALDIVRRLANLINTENGNNMLIQEVLQQQKSCVEA